VWLGFGAGSTVVTAATNAVALGDVNGDHLLDLVVGNGTGASKLYLNKGSNSSSVWQGFDTTAPTDLGSATTTSVDGDAESSATTPSGGTTHPS